MSEVFRNLVAWRANETIGHSGTSGFWIFGSPCHKGIFLAEDWRVQVGEMEGSAGTCCFLGVFKIIKVVCIITCYIPLIRVTAWKRSLST